MILSLICFTESGLLICGRLMEGFSERGHACTGFAPAKFLKPSHRGNGILPFDLTLGEWTGQEFLKADGLLFIGAAGIAVRAIAPWVKDKAADPAVVVIDDMGRFSISLLSGHLGGANELSMEAAAITGGIPVITTATDIHGRFAVDVFAKKHGLWISSMETAKRVSADMLAGEPVGFFSDFLMEGKLPRGLSGAGGCKRSIWLTLGNGLGGEGFLKSPALAGGETLRLVPRLVIAGVGCRRGTEKEDIRKAVEEAAKRCGIDIKSLFALASIDLKKDEEGMVEYAAQAGLSFHWFSAGRLRETEGEFSSSSFVKEITGVDNVCERAAICLAGELGGGRLVMRKQAGKKVTVAFAVRDWKVTL